MAIGVHALALVIALSVYQSKSASEPRVAIATFDVAQAGVAKANPKPPQPQEIPPQPPQPVVVPPPQIVLPSENLLVPASLDFSQAVVAGGGCSLTPFVQTALRANPDVLSSLPAVPEQRRSVANVLSVWKDDWIAADATFPVNTLDAIRQTVRETIAMAPPECGAARQTGPRLVYLPSAGRETVVLAFGSGDWSWNDVAASADPFAGQTLAIADETGLSLRLPARLERLGSDLLGLHSN